VLTADLLTDIRAVMHGSPTIEVEGKPYLVNQERSDNRWGRSKTVGAIRQAAYIKWLVVKQASGPLPPGPLFEFPFDRYIVIAEPRYPNRAGHPDTGSCFPSVKAIIDGARDAGVVTDDRPVNVLAHIEMPVLVVPGIPVPHLKVWVVPVEEKQQ
jgi:hypothetical protein